MPSNRIITHKRIQRCGQLCLCILLCLTLLVACGGKSDRKVHFLRFEHLLFETPADKLPAELKAHHEEFDTELLMIDPDEPEYIRMVQEFAADPVMRDIYHITDSLYHDISDIERNLGRALARAYKLCPNMEHIKHFYTMVSGDFIPDYRIYTNDIDLCICIDQYAIGAMGKYQYFGVPNYMVRTLNREFIVPDCMMTLATPAIPEGDLTLLDYAVAEGKKLYFVEKTIPGIADTILLHYTKEQLDWMEHNEANVWTWLIENKTLYSTDQSAWRNLVGEAPHTNAFGNDSAPRTVSYIGWKIVKQYMKTSGSSVEELMSETDSQKILTKSGWRP